MRFLSLKHVPIETRRVLRDRFERNLPVQRHERLLGPDAKIIPDERMLRLLLCLEVGFENAWDRARAICSAARQTDGAEPPLEELVGAGWGRVVWGRFFISFDQARAVPESMTGLAAFLKRRHGETFSFNGQCKGDPEVDDLVAAIERGNIAPTGLSCRNPDWVAARLWEEMLTGSSEPETILARWADKWSLLGHPTLVPARVWGEDVAEAFRGAAMSVIAAETGMLGWEETRAAYVRRAALAANLSTAAAESYFDLIPKALVDRALWFDRPTAEKAGYEAFDALGDIFGLARLLFEDAAAASNALAPHPIVVALTDFAIDRAELFLFLLFRVRAEPVLLADLALHPRTAALACLLVARWPSPSNAWDQALTERHNRVAKSEAFEDAVSILGEYLTDGRTPPEEAAALLKWLHRDVKSGFVEDRIDDEFPLAALRAELRRQPAEVFQGIAVALVGRGSVEGLGTPDFAALLDLVDLGNLANAIEPSPIVDSYIRSLDLGDYGLSAHRIGNAGARALFELAARGPELRERFLYPLRVKERLIAGAHENQYTLADTIARSVRAHIRMLCRAIAGLGAPPDDLVAALTVAIKSGALKHDEKGRVSAFSPRYEANSADRPLAADVGVALSTVDGDGATRILDAILETDEPLILAQLMDFAPFRMRARIEVRIAALAPTDTGEIRSLPEMQARIQQLLATGAADAAARFIEAEETLRTWGKTPGREVARFEARMRLLLLRNDWDGIRDTPEPTFASPQDQTAAQGILRSFRALAAIKRPDGDTIGAEAVFWDLYRRHPTLSHAINWFAARISSILHGDGFARLSGDDARAGREALAEAERMMAEVRPPDAAEAEIVACNKSILLLAIGQPGTALEILTATQPVRLHDTIAAYRAIALARLDRNAEALAALGAADREFGVSSILEAARGQVTSGTPAATSIAILTDENRLRDIQASLAMFQAMTPADQARAMHYPADPFPNLAIDYLRSATGSVVSLVPMMKSVRLDSREDDLTALIQQLLIARVQFHGWSVSDQSRGGVTAKGNPGERDLLLMSGETTLAIIEAEICDRPATQSKVQESLTNHFRRLFAYGVCPLLFHLIYAYIDDQRALRSYLEKMAQTHAPRGFDYAGHEAFPFTDSRPSGFVARYASELGEVKVVFLVLDMGMRRQLDAAKLAVEKTVTRRSKKPAK